MKFSFMASKLLTLVDLARSGLDYAIRISRTLTLIMALKSTCQKIIIMLVKWLVLLYFKMDNYLSTYPKKYCRQFLSIKISNCHLVSESSNVVWTL